MPFVVAMAQEFAAHLNTHRRWCASSELIGGNTLSISTCETDGNIIVFKGTLAMSVCGGRSQLRDFDVCSAPSSFGEGENRWLELRDSKQGLSFRWKAVDPSSICLSGLGVLLFFLSAADKDAAGKKAATLADEEKVPKSLEPMKGRINFVRVLGLRTNAVEA